MELAMIAISVVIWVFVFWNLVWLDKRIEIIWKGLDVITNAYKGVMEYNEKVLKVSCGIAKDNEKILAAVPDALKILEDTKKVLALAQKQQIHIAIAREQINVTSAQLEEALDAVSYLGGQMKPDEAERFFQLAKEKYGGEWAKLPLGATIDIDDSHTDK